MRLHSSIHTPTTIAAALNRAKNAGHIADHLFIEGFASHRSQSRSGAFEIKLGTYTKLPGDKRRYVNTGTHGTDAAAGLYAATWDEYGWFIAELFDADAEAIFGSYDGETGFHEATRFAYVLNTLVST